MIDLRRLAARLLALALLGVTSCSAQATPPAQRAASSDASPTGTASGPTAAAATPNSVAAAPSSMHPTDEAVPAGALEPTGATQEARVVRVVDGDTIVVQLDGRDFKVRYIGVNTPETVAPNTPVQWMGPEASAANRSLVEGRTVVLEKDVSETDRYGRLLRYVWLHEPTGWVFVNLELLRRGFAQVSTFPPDVKYADTVYLEAQRQARAAGVGLWGPRPSTPAPTRSTPAPPPPTAAPPPPAATACDPSYPTVCIPPPPPDLNCADIPFRRFKVLPPDPHRFDGDRDGIGCET